MPDAASWKYDGLGTWCCGTTYMIYRISGDDPVRFSLYRYRPPEPSLCLGQFDTLTDAMSYEERVP
jgi:hypothetical protein